MVLSPFQGFFDSLGSLHPAMNRRAIIEYPWGTQVMLRQTAVTRNHKNRPLSSFSVGSVSPW